MATFGNIKNRILTVLSESYGKESFKGNLNKFFKPIMKSETLKEMYSLYEDIETMTFDDKETAQLYVEELSKVLKGKHEEVSTELKSLNETLGNITSNENPLYESLDVLSCPDKLGNISSKVVAKKELVEHLTTSKTKDTLEVKEGVNENLLNSVLVNNFNVSFDKTLSEEDKSKFKSITTMKQSEVEEKIQEIRESIDTKLEELIKEDPSFEQKAKQVKQEVHEMESTKYNLYRIGDLLEGLS